MLKIRYTDKRTYVLTADAKGILWAKGKCSFFGGPNDPMDSGRTWSGFRTDKHPNDPYVAIPGPVIKKYNLPPGCRVTVENAQGEQVRGFLVDKGPALETGRKIDLSNIYNTELGVDTDDTVKFYIDVKMIDPRWEAGCD
jgi:hypothetical protein